MKKIILLTILIIATAQITIAQNTIAKLKFEEAEEAYVNNDFELTLSTLKEVETLLKSTNPRILYLQILAQTKIIEKNPLGDYAIIENTRTSIEKYLKDYDNLPDNEDKYRDIYKISESFKKYLITRQEFDQKEEFASLTGYLIKVKIKGLSNTKCYLAYYYGSKQYVTDTSRVDAIGEFTFKGKEKLPYGIYLIVTPTKKYFEILLSDNQKFSIETDTSNFIDNMKIKGSDDNLAFYNFLKFKSQKSDKEIKEINEYKKTYINENPTSFLSKVLKASTKPEIPETLNQADGKVDSSLAYRYYKSHFFDNINFQDGWLVRTPIFSGKIEYYIKSLTKQIPDSVIVAADFLVEKAKANKELFKYVVSYITISYETINMDAVFIHMGEKYYTKDQAYWLDEAQLVKIKNKVQKLKSNSH